VREERSYDGQQLFKRATIKVPSDIVLKGLAGCTEIIGSLVFEIPKGTGTFKRNIFRDFVPDSQNL